MLQDVNRPVGSWGFLLVYGKISTRTKYQFYPYNSWLMEISNLKLINSYRVLWRGINLTVTSTVDKSNSECLHNQKRHRLAATFVFYWVAASCQQVAASLLTSSSCSTFLKIRLVATWYLQICCKLLKQLASSLWIKTLYNQLASTLLTTCSRLATTKPEQAMQTHPDIGLMTAREQACSR